MFQTWAIGKKNMFKERRHTSNEDFPLRSLCNLELTSKLGEQPHEGYFISIYIHIHAFTFYYISIYYQTVFIKHSYHWVTIQRISLMVSSILRANQTLLKCNIFPICIIINVNTNYFLNYVFVSINFFPWKTTFWYCLYLNLIDGT